MVPKTSGDDDGVLSKSINEKSQVLERKIVQYEDLSQRFTNTKTDFSKQFAHIYAARLVEIREILTKRVKTKWNGNRIIRLADLENLEGKKCIIIGTLYKHQQGKPSILRELSEDHQLNVSPSKPDYCCEKDQAFLEDEMLRIKLVGIKVNLKEIVTGIVCAILGHEEVDGTFMVEDWCFTGCAPQQSLTCTSKGKLVLISGLDLANNSESLAVSLLSEWICGMTGNATVQKEGASITRIILAGNTVKTDTKTHIQMGHSGGKAQDNALAKEIATAVQNVDTFLRDIVACCCVTLMPGEHDPTNVMLPQKPLHPCLLPKTSRCRSFKSATNPWIGRIGERIVIGTSGQPIKDIIKASGDTEIATIEWLEKTLNWRHICPTAPDTLLAYPYHEKDLFIMKECPDIYFVGNADKFETKLWKGEENQIVRLICIPQFATTQTAVIVDLENLNTEYICFGSG